MRFSTGLMMVAGVLIALTTGLCSLLGTAGLIWAIRMATRTAPEDGWWLLMVLAMLAAGFAVAAFGIWLVRRGWARAKAERNGPA